GLLNVLFGLFLLTAAAQTARLPPQRYAAQMRKTAGGPLVRSEGLRRSLDERLAQETPESLRGRGVVTYAVWGALALLTGAVTTLGGVGMCQRRSCPLVAFSCLLPALPLVAGSACCCLGEGVGAWGLYVLLDPQVRGAFR